MRLASSFLCCLAALSAATPARAADRPNILWLIAEDFGPELACYGTSQVTSPNLDRLATIKHAHDPANFFRHTKPVAG